jgi:hypothetical protein
VIVPFDIKTTPAKRKEFMRMVEKSSTEILNEAVQAQADRAKSRDTPEGERSMRRCVEAFNALEGTNLTEAQGWRFMAVLKLARATAGSFNLDDYVDGASYMALAGEAAAKKLDTFAAETGAVTGTGAAPPEGQIRPITGASGEAPFPRREFRDAPERQGVKDMISFALTTQEAGRLMDALDEHDDCGPRGFGYKSEQLQALIGRLEEQFDRQ